jgi:DNA-binding PadR family transcriptional regulator
VEPHLTGPGPTPLLVSGWSVSVSDRYCPGGSVVSGPCVARRPLPYQVVLHPDIITAVPARAVDAMTVRDPKTAIQTGVTRTRRARSRYIIALAAPNEAMLGPPVVGAAAELKALQSPAAAATRAGTGRQVIANVIATVYKVFMSKRAMQEATFLILTALAASSQHGYGILTDVQEISGGLVRLRAGTLYTALDRLRADGLVEVDREEIVEGRLRRYYRLTPAGSDLLADEAARMQANAQAALSRLRPAGGMT